ESDWINVGKKYIDIPKTVTCKHEQLLCIPSSYESILPSNEIPVTQFLRAGKASNHSRILSSETIGAISYVIVQTYEHLNRQTFQCVHRQFTHMGLSQITHLPSNSFLTVIPGDSVMISGDHINISVQTMIIFNNLTAEKDAIVKAV
ncbi:hypothetical protein EDD18DRAFT_1053587, partial [Armillaria luteobubalina]